MAKIIDPHNTPQDKYTEEFTAFADIFGKKYKHAGEGAPNG